MVLAVLNGPARHLRLTGQPTATIGVLLEDVANPFAAELLRAVENVVSEQDCLVLCASSDGDTARDFAERVNVGMVGVNFAIPVPLAYYTFGGWKRSGFGDLNQHGPDSVRFYTKTKTVTSRWPSGTKEGAEFVIPTMR